VTRALRWILLLVVLGVAAYLAYYLLQDCPEPPRPKDTVEEAGDQLTEEDRRGLDKLIESKTKEEEGAGNP
jgi:hypothetical protein